MHPIEAHQTFESGSRPDIAASTVAPRSAIRCPKCGSQDVRDSHRRGWWDGVLEAFNLFALRCRGCRHRFHRRYDWGEAEE